MRNWADDLSEPMRTAGTLDGRWLAVALLVAYYAVLQLAGPASELAERWRWAGVYAHPKPFIDLQVFPATRQTVESGGGLYGANAPDPLNRPYNYPRVWMLFMRFPADNLWLRALGCSLAVMAVALVLLFWGRLSTGEGLFGGALLCSPAFQLGVERGNTDLVMLALLAGGVLLAGRGKLSGWSRILWWVAAILKLYPVLTFGAWFDGSVRVWLRRTWLPLVLFGAYLAVTWGDLHAILGNTSQGWVQSYGCLVPAMALAQVLAFHGVSSAGSHGLTWVGYGLAIGGVGWVLARNWGRDNRPGPAAADAGPSAKRALLGFRIGALIYIGTFIAGSNFDYRKCFLLLAVPRLWSCFQAGGLLPLYVLVALTLSLGANYLLAGWPGFFLNEAASWALLLMLTALLARSWRSTPFQP